MTTNPYFKQFQHKGQQAMVESLIIESIKKYGQDVKYLPRNKVNVDEVFGEDPLSTFDKAYDIEMYVKNVDGFSGQGRFLSNIGIEIRDAITFSVAKRRFEETTIERVEDESGYPLVTESSSKYLMHSYTNLDAETSYQNTEYIRPREGDLIYFPMVNKIFEIKQNTFETIFYQFGQLQLYDLECELFEYSSEEFNTGFTPIDDIESIFGSNLEENQLSSESGDPITDEEGYSIFAEDKVIEDTDSQARNSVFTNEVDGIVDWSDISPFVEGNKW